MRIVNLAQVKFTGYKDRPAEERKRKFVEDLREGHSVIVSFALIFSVVVFLPSGASDYIF